MSDLINRQDAIDALLVDKELLNRVLDDMDVVGTDREKYSWGLGLIESSINDIEELPSAQPERNGNAERKIGKWKHTLTYYPYCSECEWMPEEGEMTGELYNYCPDCGAYMKGEK